MQKSFLGLSSVVIVIGACGGNTSPTSPSPLGNDAGVTTNDGGVAPSDAGTSSDAAMTSDADPPDYPADVYPAPHHPLPVLANPGGTSTVMQNMKIVTVTYVGEASRDALRTFDDAVVQDAWWTAVTAGYGINAGRSGGYVELDDDVSGMTLDNDADLVPYLLDKVSAGKLPTPDADTLYALYFPKATTITLTQGGVVQTSCHDFGAYHESAGFPVGNGAINVAFAVIPNCGGGRSDSATHEFIEAATDPTPGQGWYANGYYAWFGAAGGEAADMCERYAPATDADNNSLARSWVNAAAIASHNPCQPAPAGPYFNVAIETSGLRNIGGAGPTDGVVDAKRGASTSVPLTIFSDGPLPNDVTLSFTKPTVPGSRTPVQGVTAAFSRTTGNNGSRPTLTITLAANAPVGDFKFSVKATLNATTTQSWPAVLHVL